VPVIDGNVKRFSAGYHRSELPVDKAPAIEIIRQFLNVLIADSDASVFNQAIMDFGALQCRKKPDCSNVLLCPIARLFVPARLKYAQSNRALQKNGMRFFFIIWLFV
jgi:A/G-specific adenine glycosylase